LKSSKSINESLAQDMKAAVDAWKAAHPASTNPSEGSGV
jgi:hypothetical protein